VGSDEGPRRDGHDLAHEGRTDPLIRGRQATTLVTIGVFKLSKSLLLAALALGLLHWAPRDIAAELVRLATAVHVDPDGRHLGRAVDAIAALDGWRVTAIRAGLFVYSALFLTEGIGLVLRKRWGEYWGLIVTGSFVPLEIYESARHPGALRIGVLLVNLVIVWYLARSLRRGS
jgi:uncharacterized membrane protein (DUF2068 family)